MELWLTQKILLDRSMKPPKGKLRISLGKSKCGEIRAAEDAEDWISKL